MEEISLDCGIGAFFMCVTDLVFFRAQGQERIYVGATGETRDWLQHSVR